MEPRIASLQILCRGKRFALASALVEYGGRRFRRDLLLHPGAVVILPLLDDGSVVMLRQWRPGCRCWLYELPAGTIEEGEAPEETAARELEEETGYRPGRLEHIASFYTTPGTSTEKIHAYLATGLSRARQRLEEDEVLSVVVKPFREVLGMVLAGEVEDAKTIATILLYAAKTRAL